VPLLRFVAAAFALSWLPWGALIAIGGDPTADVGAGILWILGGFGPALAALGASRWEGRSQPRRLLTGLLHLRTGLRWYGALLIPLGIALLAVAIATLAGTAERDATGFGQALLLIGPLFVLNTLVLGGNEEIGWRGYALPRLQQRMSALAASVLLGLVWGAWHLPLFFMAETAQASLSPSLFAVNAIALSVIFTWLYNSTAGSLLLAVLFHGAINTWYSVVVVGLVPDDPQAFTTAATFVAAAIAVGLVALFGPSSLAPTSRRTR